MSQLQLLWLNAGAGVRLIIINVAAFVILFLPLSLLHLMNMDSTGSFIMNQLELPGNVMQVLFKPWTLITHLFVHSGLMHILFNMMTLYFTYQLFNQRFDDKRFLNVYFVSGFAGALMFLLSVNLFPLFSENAHSYSAVGASAAVMGVLIAICTYRPQDEVMLFGVFKLKLQWMALIFVLLDLISIRSGNEGGHLAHLGGALFGFFWAVNMKKGTDIAAFFNKAQAIFSWKPKRKSTIKVVHKRAKTDDDFNLDKRQKQKRIDDILDKISRSGYDSLSKEEKALLFELSKEN
jgi:membrane associated rhomboid family serine protease